MNPTPLFRTLTVALATAMLMSVAAHGATEAVVETFPLKPDGHVRLANVNGRVEVRAWDGDGARLEAVKEGKTPEILAGIKIVTESTPDQLLVRTELAKVKRGWLRGSSHEGQVSYVLSVPATAMLEKIESVNGSLKLEGMKGGIHATSVNGSIRGNALAGSATLSTVNGSITTTHTDLPAEGRFKASSVNGAIEVQFPVELSADLEASTVNGAVRSDFAMTTTTKRSKRSVEARIGGGGARVQLDTVNGGIRVRKAGNEHAAAR